MLRHLGRDAAVAEDDGRDLALGLEVGLALPASREKRWLSTLASARRLVVAEGLLHRFLRERLPGATVVGVAEALLDVRTVRAALRPTDLLVFEARGYHADFERLVRVYDRVRRDTGCLTNLDLHRLAISTGAASAQARLGASRRGRGFSSPASSPRGAGRRESWWRARATASPSRAALGLPVVHLAEVA